MDACMYTLFITRVCAIFLSYFSIVSGIEVDSPDTCQTLLNWPENSSIILPLTEKKPSRTAILIIEPPVINGGYIGWR